MANDKTESGSIGFFGLLTLIFITLKLCGVISWSWWTVTAPLWVPSVVSIFVLMVIASRR